MLTGALEPADLKEAGPPAQLQQKRHVLLQHQAFTRFESVSTAMFHLRGPNTSLQDD